MRSRAAVPQGVGQDWKIEEITLDPPKAGEVLVRMHAAGICHSDDHFATGDGVPSDDMTAMMKAAGVVEEVGEGVTSLRPGDHVATSFLPAWRVQVVLVWNELPVRCRRAPVRQGDGDRWHLAAASRQHRPDGDDAARLL